MPATMEGTAMVISVTPVGQELEEAATFTIPYEGNTPPDMVYYLNPDDGVWYIVSGEIIVDEENKLVTFQNTTLTAYGAGSTINLERASGSGGGGGGCFINSIALKPSQIFGL